MLKTLEEPPEYLKFVLATTDPQKVPVTVLSRCLQFNLRPLPAALVAEHLATVLRDEHVAHDAAALKLLARAARGSMRDALSLTDQAIAYGAGTLAEGAVRQMLGAVDRSHAVRLVRALAAGDGRELIAGIEALRELGLSCAGTLEELAALAQQIAVLHAVPDAAVDDDPDAAIASQLAPLLGPDETQLLYSLALHGRAELALAPDEYAGLVMVLLRFLAFRPADGGESERRSIPAKTAPNERASAVPERAEASPPSWLDEPPSEGEVSPATALQWTPLGDRWAQVVGQLIERGVAPPLVRELAMQAQCVDMDGERWVLRVESDSLRAQADKLLAALAAVPGAPVALEVARGSTVDTPAKRAAAERERRQREAEALIHNDPLVQEMMRQFSTARIVPGSVKPH
jgi:DNA polymerase-3 subunit gamma/tau